MKKRNLHLVIFILVVILVSMGIYITTANDDATCYTFTSTVSSCSVNEATCTPRNNGVKHCDGTNTITYKVASSYRCSIPNSTGRSYSVNGVCRVEFTDMVTPSAEGGIE